MIKNCYIHIPFCKSICTYCDFCKIFYNKKFINKYLNALSEEIDSIYNGEELDTIYIGGGTPSSLDIDELRLLFKILSKLKRSSNCSITIENNFDSISYEKLDLYKEFGVNRLSFGIESIDSNNLSFMGRSINTDIVIEIIEYCKNIGINDINVDLIYALPGEDIKTVDKDLDFILNLDITHISTYSLIIEEHTKLFIDKVKNISEDLDSKMYYYICNKLRNNNYKHYEISNFCKEGYESIHNNCYWENREYYGFGLGASSYIGNMRITNTRSLKKYINSEYIDSTELIDNKSLIEYEIMLNLRLGRGIDLVNFKNKFGMELSCLYDYSYLVNNGLLVLCNNKLFISEEKWYISNSIIVKLLESEIDG